MLGLGSTISKNPKPGKSIVKDNLVLQHNYNRGFIEPLSDGAAYFNVSNTDYIDTNATFQSTFRDSFSISMWIRVLDGIPSSEQTILGCIKASEDGVRVDVLTDGKLRFAIEPNNDPSYITTSAAVFSDGPSDWTHIFCTATNPGSGNISLVMYVNGTAVATALSNATAYDELDDYTSDINLLIGARMNDTTPERHFDGYICNVGIWDAALDQAQAKSIMWKKYSQLTSSETADLVSWWNLDSTIESTTSGTPTGTAYVYDNHHGGGSSYGSELSPNASFDDNITGWVLYGAGNTISHETSTVYSGTGALRTTNGGANDWLAKTTDALSSIETYSTYLVNGYAYVPTGWDGGDVFFTDGNSFGQSEAFLKVDDANKDQWQYCELIFNTAADVSGRVFLRASSTPSATKYIIWDSISIKKINGNTGTLA